MFSERVPRSLEPNRITLAIRRARSAGRPLIDLTVSNPTNAAIEYGSRILEPLSSREALIYDPQPFGLPSARRAVADDYTRRGVGVDPAHIVLTASTSEAYSTLFKLLCSPGDAVLVPVPSYPLFDHLTGLDGVRSIPYRLDYHGRWALDVDHLDQAWSRSVRAVMAVSPNNPTGSVLSSEELCALETRCAARDAALIVDEVFADYPLGPGLGARDSVLGVPGFTKARGVAFPSAYSSRPEPRTPNPEPPTCLTFRLGGLSKSAGLPQVKLGWIAVDGPEPVLSDALDRLEVISDAYLSVSTPVQVAAAALISSGAGVREQVLTRIRGNYHVLLSAASAHPSIEALPAQAGWSGVLRVPSTRSEEELVIELVERDGVVVHPGFFFDFPHEAFVVVSLLAEPRSFAEGVRRLLERADG
jgi:alanine-synthesizing transaminase